MAELYVGNCTKQNIEFHFRVPEHEKVFMLPVAMGKQECIPVRNLNTPQVEAIIHQLEEGWGGVPGREVGNAREFVGICYSIDTPLAPKLIERGFHHNDDVLEKRGVEFRKQTAVAINAASDFSVKGKNNLLSTETIITEVPERGGRPTIDETVQVVNRGEAPTTRGRKRAA